MITAKSVLEYTKQMTLLYVEDDLSLQENTKLLFENFFLSVTTANDGQEGLDLYLKSHAAGNPYDLIISDINMPHMDGIAMGEAILEKEHMQAFVFITAHNEISFLGSALQMGVSGFLTKPIQNDLLLKTLYRLAQAFCDRKSFTQQYDAIEILNIELIKKNESLEKLVRLLNTSVKKEQIIATTTKVQSNKNDNALKDQTDQINLLLSESIHELKDLHVEIDTSNLEIINAISSGKDYQYDLSSLVNNFQRYASILLMHHCFTNLSQSISTLAGTLKTEPPRDNESLKNAFALVESFIYVLGKWQISLEEINIANINYFDASIISDTQTIINIWQGTQLESEDSIEFF